MLGHEPECRGVFCMSREIWERGSWSVQILSSCLTLGLPEGREEAINEIRGIQVLEKLLTLCNSIRLICQCTSD